MNTFQDLFCFLQKLEETEFFNWLEKSWNGKDKQESLLRLFTYLKLIDKLIDYTLYNGNYNLVSLTKFNSNKEFFVKKLKDNGDYSDLTCFNDKNEKEILVCTSKNLNKYSIGKLDISKINEIFDNKYKINGYKKILCLCVRNSYDFIQTVNRTKKTSITLSEQILAYDTIIIDQNDLFVSFKKFIEIYKNVNIKDIINTDLKKIILKFHQEVSVYKTINIKNSGEKNCLYGHIPRSGKTYIMCGTIINDIKTNDENYLIITPCPNETIQNYLDVFNCIELKDFSIIHLNRNCKNNLKELVNTNGKNIIIVSKQFLQTKSGNVSQIKILKEMKFSITFLDETHYGETTELTKNILKIYGLNSFKVFITATYFKPVNSFDIKEKNWILWDLEDISLCKEINKPENKKRLIYKHGEYLKKLLNIYSEKDIIEEYSKYPELVFLTEKINETIKKEIKELTLDNDYGYSCYSCLTLKQDENQNFYNSFKDENKVIELFHRIFGKYNKYDILENKSYFKSIDKICEDNKNKIEQPVIMVFLPINNTDIDLLSKTLIKLLEEKTTLGNYYTFGYINGKKTRNPKKDIEDYSNITKNSNKLGTIIFSGKQCSLGVTINNCDIVVLLNNTKSFDNIYQMMFRSMTERKDKKFGFVIDLNTHRVINTVYNYSNYINRYNNPKKNIKYLIEQNLIKLVDKDIDIYENKEYIIEKMYNFIIKSDELTNVIKSHFDLIDKIEFKFDTKTLKKLEKISKKVLNPKIQKQIVLDLKKNNIKDGLLVKRIIKEKEDNEDNQDNKDNEDKEEKEDNEDNEEESYLEEQILIEIVKNTFISLFKTILTVSSILTINEEIYSLIENINFIKNDLYLLDIFYISLSIKLGLEQFEIEKFLNFFISGYINYMEKETREIQKLLISLIKDSKKDTNLLSQMIDTYLIPTLIEKKMNAEISTPKQLRKDMLDTITTYGDKDFWKTPKKVFEPCCGKGGFVIDIYTRFFEGLKEKIPDEKERKRVILEECIYFSDINPLNVFICKMLLIGDDKKKYKLNYNEGDTLILDIQKKWGLTGFDAVIGNPPYNKNLYKKFIKYFFNKYELLLFVIPSSITIGVSHSGFMKYLKDNGLISVNYVEKKIWKENINIETIYLMLKKNYNGDIKINNINIKRNERIFNIDKNYIKILEKLKNYNKMELFKGKNKTLNYKNPQETENIKIYKNDKYKYKILSRLNGGKGEEIYYTDIKGYFSDGYKLLLPRGTGTYNSKTALKNTKKDLVYSKITKKNIMLSTSIVYLNGNSLEECDFFRWYILRSKFVRFLFIKENKFSELTKGFVGLIPFIDYKKCNKTDYSVYNYLKLSQEEINLIEQTLN